MTLLPKPPKRARKPPKALRRGKAPQRRSRPAAQRRTKRAAQERELDRLWSRWVLADEPLCWSCQRHRATDPAHIVPRRYKRTRWLLANGLPLCRACHDRYTRHPRAWDCDVSRAFPATFAHLWRMARYGPMPDLAAARAELAA
jgi:hypothetical protein